MYQLPKKLMLYRYIYNIALRVVSFPYIIKEFQPEKLVCKKQKQDYTISPQIRNAECVYKITTPKITISKINKFSVATSSTRKSKAKPVHRWVKPIMGEIPKI